MKIEENPSALNSYRVTFCNAYAMQIRTVFQLPSTSNKRADASANRTKWKTSDASTIRISILLGFPFRSGTERQFFITALE